MHTSRLKYAIAAAVAAFSLETQASPAYFADPSGNHDLAFLNQFYSECAEYNSGLKAQGSMLEVKRIAVATEDSRNLPTIDLDANTGPAKVWPYKETTLKSKSAQAEWNTESKLTLRQKIYSGGVDSNGREIAESEYQIQKLEYQSAQAGLWSALASDLLEITRLHSLLRVKDEMLQDAQEVQKVAQRKSQSGFLGRKELLESERETFRSENEKQNALSSLDNAVASFNIRYQLKKNTLKRDELEKLQQYLHTAAGKGLLELKSANTLAALGEANLELAQKKLAERSATFALRRAAAQRFSPNLDLLAGLSATHQNTLQHPEGVARKEEAPDGNLRSFASLNFSVRLYDPVANSENEASTQRLTAAKLNTEQIRFNLEAFTKETNTKKASLEKSIDNQSRLVTLSEDLRLKSNRLFEAGEIDILEMISSQKELSLQRQALIELETQLFALGIRTLLALEFGYIATGTAETQKP